MKKMNLNFFKESLLKTKDIIISGKYYFLILKLNVKIQQIFYKQKSVIKWIYQDY